MSVAGSSVYVASPLGFAATTRAYYEQTLLPLLRSVVTCLDPWAAPFTDMTDALLIAEPAQRVVALRAANARHGAHNRDLLLASRAVFAVLDGPDVDSGTAAEIGFAAARGLPVVGWRSDLRVSGDNEAALVNLQVEYFCDLNGGGVYTDLGVAVQALVSACSC